MGESSNPLTIDPFVLLLQVVAFIILFLLLRKFLFRPLLEVIARREQELAEGLAAGARAKAELSRLDQEREQVLSSAREEGRQHVRLAVQEGEQAREHILREARDEAQDLKERAHQSIEQERQEVMLQLRHEVVDLALLAARQAVLTPLEETKHRQIVDDFISSLEQRA